MARVETKATTKPVQAVEEADEVDDYLNALAEEVIEEAETPKEVKGPKAAKTPKAPKEGSVSRGPKTSDPNMVTPAILAEQLGTDPRSLRMFLRSTFTRNEEEKSHSWAWAKGSKELQEVIDAWNAKGTKKAKTEKIEKVEADTEAVESDEVDEDEEEIDEDEEEVEIPVPAPVIKKKKK